MGAVGWLGSTVALLAMAACGAGWLRAAALRRVEVETPDDATLRRARIAGERIARAGPLALALAGGGAKGAYQVGCWKALRACGIDRFDAVAGTSVGALNAVLVGQGDWQKAEAIWHDMHFGRVLRLRWTAVLAVMIRAVLFVPLLGRLAFPARFIPVALWRAVRAYRRGRAAGDPRASLRAALDLYGLFISRTADVETTANLVLLAISVAGASMLWLVALPLVEIAVVVVIAPIAVLLLTTYAAWFATALDQLSTRLVLASNEPLHDLLVDCVDVARLQAAPGPLFVTLASLREVVRWPAWPTKGAFAGAKTESEMMATSPGDAAVPVSPTNSEATQNRNFGHLGDRPGNDAFSPFGLDTSIHTVEYVPSHFDVKVARPDKVLELILQSAGLPEIFPARRIDGDLYVDGGMVDNVPVSALVGVPGLVTVIVVPLDRSIDERIVRRDLAANLVRLGRPLPTSLPELVVLTPSRPLGSFVTGTLDFGARRSRALMTLGFADTVRALATR